MTSDSLLERRLLRLGFLLEMMRTTIGSEIHRVISSLERSGAPVEELDAWMRRFARMSRTHGP